MPPLATDGRRLAEVDDAAPATLALGPRPPHGRRNTGVPSARRRRSAERRHRRPAIGAERSVGGRPASMAIEMPAPHTGQAVVTVASASSAAPIPSGSYAHQFRNSAAPRVRRCGPSVRLSPAARVIAPSSSRSIQPLAPRSTRIGSGVGPGIVRAAAIAAGATGRRPARSNANAVSRTAPAGPSLITSRRPDSVTARLGNYVVDLLWFDDCRNHEDVRAAPMRASYPLNPSRSFLASTAWRVERSSH